METFDIHRIIKSYNLEKGELSKILFPKTKFPKHAFSRILKGEALLDSKQITDLAAYIGITVKDLFSVSKSEWKGTSEDGHLVFCKENYKVKLAYKGSYLTLYKGSEAIYEEIVGTKSMSLEEFITHIDNLILNNNGRN
jgi:hypothetical protein